jgi:hypothetical protein
MYYESNKAFYFTNIEALIDIARTSKQIYQEYVYIAANRQPLGQEGGFVKDIDADYRKVQDMHVVTGYNALKNTQTGYLANRLYTFDVVTKNRGINDYNHFEQYSSFRHMQDISGTAVAPFKLGIPTEAAGFNQFYPQHDQLYAGVRQNAGDIIDKILPIRTSTAIELTNLKIEITVPGRTDAEVGNLIYFHYPDAAPKDETDKNLAGDDLLYSGHYLITAIRHKINGLKHVMIMEIVKDSILDIKKT